jgi:hypothetical protein
MQEKREQDGRFFSKLTRPSTISKLRQHILSPMIHHNHRNNSNSCAHDDENVDRSFDENERCLDSGKVMSTPALLDRKQSATRKVSVPILKKEFYIGYRRRDPDEVDVPGISDCKIVYCRIHKDSILPEKKDLGKRLRIIHNGVHGGGTGVGGSYNNEVKVGAGTQKGGATEGVTKNLQTKNNNGQNQKTTVAVMKKSLLATAEIAKNVVNHGRDKLRMAVAPGMNDVTPNFHTKEETGNQVAHGKVDNCSFPSEIGKEQQYDYRLTNCLIFQRASMSGSYLRCINK